MRRIEEFDLTLNCSDELLVTDALPPEGDAPKRIAAVGNKVNMRGITPETADEVMNMLHLRKARQRCLYCAPEEH